MRGPQSMQSVPMLQMLNSDPVPPSSQSPSEAWVQLLVHTAPGANGGERGLGGGSEGGGVAGDGRDCGGGAGETQHDPESRSGAK